MKQKWLRNTLISANLFMILVCYYSWGGLKLKENEFDEKLDPKILKNPLPQIRPKNTILTKVKVFPRGGDNLKFDQPWKLQKIEIVNNLDGLDRSKRYLTSNFTYSPGLGNLMFQFASVKAVAEEVNATLIVPSNNMLRRAFGRFDEKVVFVDPILVDRLILSSKNQGKHHDFTDCCRHYPDIAANLFLKPPSTNDDQQLNVEVISGYFQSFKYFHPKHEDLVRKYFTFLPGIRTKAESILSDARYEKVDIELELNDQELGNDQMVILPDNFDNDYYFIGVHVRHGMDLTFHSRNQKHGHLAAPPAFYKKSMDYFLDKFPHRKIIFIIASDDNTWTRRNFLSETKGQIIFLDNKNREVDMAVLSLCNATILSTGTFSWWSSYLSRGPTVYFNGWPRSGSDLDKMLQKPDYFLPNWTPM